MSKQWVMLVVGAVIIILGAIFLFGSENRDLRNSEGRDRPGSQMSVTDVDSIPEGGRGSFAELLALGGNAECDFSYSESESGSVVRGVMYMTDRGSRFRGDFTMMRDGMTYETHVVRDGERGYTWSQTPMGSMAFMFDINEEEDVFDSNESVSFNYDQEFDYSCNHWSVDESLFVPPADIEFTNMADMMQGQGMQDTDSNMGNTNNMKAMQCAACEGITDAASKAQCKAALDC